MIKKINFIDGKKKLVVTFLLVIFLVSFISAFGVVTPYWEGNELQVFPGETVVVNLGVQNLVGDEDIIVTITLLEGSEIASVPEREYLIAAGTKDTQIPVTISIPLNTSLVDSRYSVKVSFLTTNDGEGISLGTGINSAFDVLVVLPTEEKPEVRDFTLLVILGIIAVILVLIYIFRKKLFGKKK